VLIDGLGVVGDGGLDEFGQAMTDRMLPQAAQRLRQIEDELGGREPDDEADSEMFALEWPSYFVDPLTAPPFGAQSPMPVSQGEQTAALIAGAEVRIIPAAGHLPWYEQPGCVAAALASIQEALAPQG
jgi:pimeloyl-ACP methyl ester carboxylesterase